MEVRSDIHCTAVSSRACPGIQPNNELCASVLAGSRDKPGMTVRSNTHDIIINLQGDVLTIATKQQENERTTDKWTRREYQPGGFERQFVLNEKIDRDNISARYDDGVLVIALQKLPGHDGPAQEIVVA